MARLDLAIGLEKQVKRCLEMGASLVLGGERNGNFFTPTILSNISENMPAYREELFGPVFTMIPFESDEEVINMANSSEYGLGATIWSQDIERAENLAAQIDSGCVFINTMVRSDQRVPFGGVKKSGYGRELSSNGIREFVNIKTVWVE
jgi:succinate-semialdehyde dehydrogenase/glutarate-semialdehyde dehydrogenase